MEKQIASEDGKELAGVATESPRPAPEQGLQWVEVNDSDDATLPPIDKIVLLIYLSDYNDGQVIELGGRTLTEWIDDETRGWEWGVLDSKFYVKDWEAKLYGLEVDDDYRVTHWSDIGWPAANAPEREAETQKVG